MLSEVKGALQLPAGYPDLLQDLKRRIGDAQLRASFAVSRELVLLYWSIGREGSPGPARPVELRRMVPLGFLRGVRGGSMRNELTRYTDLKSAAEERERLRQLEADLAHINRVSMVGESRHRWLTRSSSRSPPLS